MSLRSLGQITWRAVLVAVAMAGPAVAGPVAGDGSDADNARLLPQRYPETPLEPVLAGSDGDEPYHPFFDTEWSLGLRGSYRQTDSDERFEVLTVPSVVLEHQGSRSQIDISGSAEIVRPDDGAVDVSGLRLNLGAGYALDSLTNLTTDIDFSVTREQPGAPGVGSDIEISPKTTEGGAAFGVTRQFGKFNLTGNVGARRTVYGPTTLADGTRQDNGDQDVWQLDGTLRLGFAATPIIEVFGEAGLGRDLFDEPDAVLGIRPDASDGSIKGGLVGRWNTVEAEASLGLNLRRFDEASVGDVVSRLYDAKVTFTPDPTWRFVAGFSTVVGPPGPDNGGTTRIDYNINGEVNYTVNSWLALRALADWQRSSFEGSSETERRYGFGFGADYLVNVHTDVSADYGYSHTETSGDGEEDSHRVTLGVTLKR